MWAGKAWLVAWACISGTASAMPAVGNEPARPTLLPEHIFFAIEGDDMTLKKENKKRLRDLCTTWLSHIPWGRAAVFSDNYIEMPPECREIGLNEVLPCCPGNTSLGDSIATAQLKRENLHYHLLDRLPPDVRWIVSTEQDVWWGLQELWTYLSLIEIQYSDLDLDSVPAFVGPNELGPFVVFNRAWLSRYYGNKVFMDQCRHSMFTDFGEAGWARLQYRYPGAAYNNDHLMTYCVWMARNEAKTNADGGIQRIILFPKPRNSHDGGALPGPIETAWPSNRNSMVLYFGMNFNGGDKVPRERPREILNIRKGGHDMLAYHHISDGDFHDLERYSNAARLDWRHHRVYETFINQVVAVHSYGCYNHNENLLHQVLGRWENTNGVNTSEQASWGRLSCIVEVQLDQVSVERVMSGLGVWSRVLGRYKAD